MSEEKKEHDTMHKEKESVNKKKSDFEFMVQMVAIVVLVALLFYAIGRPNASGNAIATGIGTVSASGVIPTGVPENYGSELGISYDDVSPNNPRLADKTIKVLGNIDRSETLQGEDLQRYIRIMSQISCEYCCGAKSVIFENGEPACGCAHSYAMRGLAKYLIKNHGEEYTDDEILAEAGKWKVLFFPGIHEGKAEVLKSKGIEVNYVNLASNKYRGIENGQASGGMVGGC